MLHGTPLSQALKRSNPTADRNHLHVWKGAKARQSSFTRVTQQDLTGTNYSIFLALEQREQRHRVFNLSVNDSSWFLFKDSKTKCNFMVLKN